MDAITHNKPKKLTDKQIQFFANKLAHHDPFASKKAAVGESYADLEKRLLIELQDVCQKVCWCSQRVRPRGLICN